MRCCQKLEVINAVIYRTLADRNEPALLLDRGRNDELAAAIMAHTSLPAVRVQLLAPGHAGARLQRTRRVVNAGVNYLAVARTRFGADISVLLNNQHLAAGTRQCTRTGQPCHPGANNEGINRFGHAEDSLRC